MSSGGTVCVPLFSMLAPATPSLLFFFFNQKIFKQYFIRKKFKIIFVCFYHLPVLL